MTNQVLLYSYRMSYDEGFAPNPYFGVLTLATCKPAIRRNSRIPREINHGNEVWLSGWAAKRLAPPIGGERSLIWLGKVAKVIPLSEYWELYPKKQPAVTGSASASAKGCGSPALPAKKGCSSLAAETEHNYAFYGDNIYRPCPEADLGFEWQPNNFHEEWNKSADVGGKNVLICEEFYYFGHKDYLLQVPEEFMPQASTGRATRLDCNPQHFINYVKAQPCLISHLNPIPEL